MFCPGKSTFIVLKYMHELMLTINLVVVTLVRIHSTASSSVNFVNEKDELSPWKTDDSWAFLSPFSSRDVSSDNAKIAVFVRNGHIALRRSSIVLL